MGKRYPKAQCKRFTLEEIRDVVKTLVVAITASRSHPTHTQDNLLGAEHGLMIATNVLTTAVHIVQEGCTALLLVV